MCVKLLNGDKALLSYFADLLKFFLVDDLDFSSAVGDQWFVFFHSSMVISRSVAKLDNVRMALEVVIFDRLAKSSRER